MRVSAVGWLFDTLEETEKVAKISAEITHNHPEGIKGARRPPLPSGWQGTAIPNPRSRNISKADTIMTLTPVGSISTRRMTGIPAARAQSLKPSSAVLESKDFEDAIRKAVSVGGDSDTLACITGGIAEASYNLNYS